MFYFFLFFNWIVWLAPVSSKMHRCYIPSMILQMLSCSHIIMIFWSFIIFCDCICFFITFLLLFFPISSNMHGKKEEKYHILSILQFFFCYKDFHYFYIIIIALIGIICLICVIVYVKWLILDVYDWFCFQYKIYKTRGMCIHH